MNNKKLGNTGEILAQKFLKKQGYKILEKNYSNKIGEIDLICYNKKEDCYIFVEVKTRSSLEFGSPAEAVNFHKQNKIRKTAEVYLLYNKLIDKKVQFDIVEVLNDKINHIKNAF